VPGLVGVRDVFDPPEYGAGIDIQTELHLENGGYYRSGLSFLAQSDRAYSHLAISILVGDTPVAFTGGVMLAAIRATIIDVSCCRLECVFLKPIFTAMRTGDIGIPNAVPSTKQLR